MSYEVICPYCDEQQEVFNDLTGIMWEHVCEYCSKIFIFKIEVNIETFPVDDEEESQNV